MNHIKIIETGSYLPEMVVGNSEIEKRLDLSKGFIEKRTGIKQRFIAKEETIEEMAIQAVKNLIKKREDLLKQIGLIIVATTTSSLLMPGISNLVQKEFEISNCICFDILAGCGGFINAVDIANLYLKVGKIEKALIIGVEILSNKTNEQDIGTSILLGDGAGAVLLGTTKEDKKYHSYIQAEGEKSSILTCKAEEKVQMNGTEIYKYAVTETVKNIQELLKQTQEKIENIDYIVPHQSNLKIMKAMATRLKINFNKIYTNIEQKGNTFCASIPIALDEMKEDGKLKEGSKIILLGYGGGLNTGSILIEI